MPPAAPARLALALGLGLWLGALAGGPGRGCGPCEPPCLCSPAPGAACRVNCSGRGLRTLGPALRIPADATALDVSHNLLRALDVGLLANLSALAELDISNNKISTLEEGIFANLFNLSEINLSGNPFECDCGLAWLPRWAEEQQVRVVQPEAATCAGPGSLAGQPLLGIPLLDSGCGEEYVACLPDNSSGTMAAVSFSAAHEGLLQPEACSAFCFSTGQGLAALSEQGWCLCGAVQPSSASFACLSLCSGPPPPPAPTCGGPTLLQHVFPASPGAALVGPHGPLASGQLAAFHIAAPLPVTATRWDFGDGSPEVDAAGPAASHRYVLPGRYHVTAVLALGAGSALLGTNVQVEAAPATLELVCPSSVQSDESLELSIQNRGGSGLEAAYSIVALGEEPARVVHPLCPSDTEIFPGNGHCYRLVVEKAAWLQAQEQCRAWAGAALAMVDSPAVQRFLVSRVTRSLDVWIGFSTVQGAEVGPAPQGEAFSLESCQNWLPGEPHPATAEHCVRLGPTGWCNTDLCSAPHSYVCELRPGGPVQDAENLLVGAPSGDLQGPLTPLAQQDGLSAPHQPVEVMVFPGLSPSHEAFLTAAEFGTQELRRPAQLRLQVYRLLSTAGTPENGSEPESRSLDNRTQLAPACMPGGRWCPGANVCLPLDASCHPQACANGCTSGPGLPGAPYALWREFLFSVPAGPPAQYSVTLHSQDVLVLPGDLVGLQHDAGPGALLRCSPAPGHPGPQAPYLSANASSWLPHLPAQLEGTRACPACALRLLAATEQLTVLLGLRPNPGLRLPGRYEVRAEVGNGVSGHNLSCTFEVVSAVAGLRVIYPTPRDGRLYVPTNGSALVLQVDSGANATATARWPGGNVSARFEAACPALVATFVPGCPWETNDTLFSVVALPWLSEGEHVVDVVVENSASQANLSLRVTAEEPICGLRATPSPEARVLQGVLVRYSPVVEAGSDMVFRWTINDKPSLTFQNVVFNVIYQSAAVFKLSLTASNHVSNVTVNYNVTVERMNRMQGLRVSTVPAVLCPNATLALTAGVLVDSAVEVAFLWTFGDGEQALHQFQPPYNKSFPVPDPSVAQVLVEHNVTHTYAAPGEYILTVLASNAFENLTQQVPVSVRAALPSVAVGVSDSVLVAGRPITFYPHPLPSPGGVLYMWDFGDGSPVLTQSQPAANHTYASRGTYHVRLEVNNTVSGAAAQADVRVFEELRGLRVDMSLAVEQGAPVVVSATVQTGDNITWTFDMGDGTVLSGPEATVEHVYLRAQNCTVTVGAASPAGHLARSLHVLVFVLEVLRIEPAACIPMQPDARLTAYVTGNPAHYLFDWTFGDGSSNTTVRGCPMVTHNFTRSGTFPLALVLSSRVNKAHYFTSICVEPEVGNVTLQPERQFVQLGDEARLVACAWPPFPYRYTWDFGTEEAVPARAGGPEVTFIYRDPGSYLVTVTASNNISAANDSALVEVQEPVVVTDINVNGSLVLELQQPYLFSAVGRGRPASYLWDLGDGGRLEGPEVTHTYNSTGDFTVRVAGWNEVSRSEAWLNVTVKRRVRGLVVNASRTVVPLNGSVSFSTSLEAGSDVRYSWVLCDRCTPIPGGPTISYTFRSVGTFNIIVTAENEVGSAQDSIFVYVLQLIEGLQVAGGGRYFPTNHTVQLQAVVRDGTNISYSWTAWRDRGPALAGSGKDFSFTALEAGTYHVQLRATNMLGSAWADCTVDFVEPVGWLMVAASPNPAAVDTSVTLSAELAGGSGVVYTWSLEEGQSWETPEPFTTHSFPTPGLHLVTITAGNPLGSANATVEVDVQVPVSGLSIRASEPGGSFVAAGSSVPFWGQLATGTNVSWCWAVPGSSSKRGPHVTMVFPDAGTFSIRLNASNAVSWVSATHNITVEEPIVGLVLWASSKVVAPGQLVHFQILLAAGSAVTFRLQVGAASPEVLPGPRFSHSFPRVGDHVVSVQGKNHVSWAQAQVRIVVLEAVSGLQVPNCCEPGIATGTERNFTARVQRGSRVAYAWYFSLQKVQGDSLVILSGRDVTYTPVAAGLLEIQVRAFNALGSENRTLVLEVQDAVQYVALRSGPCFTNRSVQFEAATSPSPRRVAYRWDFGDGSPGQDTDEPRAEHSYLRPGDYRVQVNASNLVSFFVAQATVTVQVLACREPEVDVVLPLQVLMRRSQRNYLEAHVDLRDCVTYQTEYRWEVYRTASCQRPGRPARVALPGVDVSRPQLVLPRLALPVGHYCFVFVVSFGDTPLARSIQANVTVAPERLVPIIEGGSYRVWSDTQDLVLDGSESYDPNLEDGDQTPLSFHWACVASTQREAGGCALNFGPRGSSMVSIPRERLVAGVEYTFSLTVWKAGRKEEATNQTGPSRELVCRSCLKQTLHKLEAMMRILQAETTTGTVTPTAIGDSILNITGDLIHLASSDVWAPQPSELGAESPSRMVASQAYNLTSALMRILMRSRVLNEEPLTLAGEEIVAQGKRSDPRSLLCYGGTPGPGCHFSIPEAFSGALANLSDVVQVIFLVDSNPFPFGYISNYTVSTKVASMAFQTQAGAQIPIERLASERAITVKVPNNSDWAARGHRSSANSIVVQPQASVGAVVTLDSSNPAAGLHLQLNYTLLDGRYLSEEPEPFLAVYLHSEPRPNEHNCSASRRIRPESLQGADHRPYTFFISPGTRDPAGSYHLNLSSHFRWSALEVSVGLYTSLCQYFSEEDMVWRTEGLLPLEETSPRQAVCLTRHLTAFGASLFVPPSHVRFVFPEPTADVNYIVMLTCAVCLVTYMVMAAILHKLDQLDASRGRAIPFCGQRGRFKYEILVKTGWGRGSGTTAHVGIMLYGVDSRSGHRHLDGDRAFHRNSLDIFRIATPHSLGSVWKIRVWHDNKGLSPAWFLQHIIVRDLQTARSAFFLVNDWLSVETEANGGLVEKEVLAASDAALLRFRRLLVAELQRGFFDKHIWLSIWDRPPRSRFTRIQRATCCVLLICLFLGANAVWYGAVGDSAYSMGRVSRLSPLSVDTVAVGLVSSVVVYPIYLAILFLFRMSRSKVAGSPSPTPAGQQVLDIDSCLDSSVLDSSFLTFSGLHAEQAFAGQMKSDLFLDDSKSLVCWPSSEGTLSWPDLLSDPSIVGSNLRQLARGQAGHGLGPEEDGFSLASPYSPAKSFSASDEDLIQQVLAEGVSSPAPTQDTHMETDLLNSLSSTPGEKTETLALQRLGELGPPSPGLTWEQPQAARLSRTGLVEGLRKRLLPAWCASLAHGLSLLLVAVAVAVSGWVGASFPPGVSVAWLLSSSASFLASFLGWEPLKVLLEALYFSLVAKRLHPDEDDTLVESPAVTPVSARVPRVRPPHGFALFLAKEEARKVKRLHGMLRSLLVYMLFLLVTLLASYGDASCHGHAYRLQSAIKQELHSRAFLAITRSEELWPWMAHVLLPYVHGNQSSPELGPPRLRQVRLQEALCPDPPGPRVHTCSAAGGFSTSDYDVGWESPHNGSGTWAYSAPDLLGAWSWGSCAVYDSGGYVQELGLSLEESRDRLRFLQLHNWLDNRSRAVFVELTRYSPAVGLHAAVTLRLEFPAAGRALAALSVRPFALRRLSAGLSLPLLTSVCLLLFALHFAVAEARTWHREGRWRVLRPGAWARWLLVALTAATALVRLAQLGAADRQWTRFVRGRPRRFTSFDQVAQLNSAARGLAASLLFLLLVKAAQQLRFVRQWSVFGKTLCRALPELLGVTLGLVVLGVAYAQLAVLLVSSCVDSLWSVAQALLVLCPGTGFCTLCPAESWHLSPLLCVGLWALRLWGALRLGAVILRWRYHALRGELYRPAWEPQDYEMVELFLRRLRLWMGLSKVKEFRHKVRFEGMEPLPSRSSRGSKVSPDVPPPSAGSDASHPSTSSSQLDGLSVSLGRLGTRSEPEPSRLQAVFEALLTQFDRLNQATEDVYQLEQQLHSLQGRRSSRVPAGPSRGPSPGLRQSLPSRLARASRGVDLATGPSRTPLRAKNKVHPSST
uniref:Polycystin-1 n=2 Tax=Pongo abelii TaxID=9601 RepID=H2NPT1_PONAB